MWEFLTSFVSNLDHYERMALIGVALFIGSRIRAEKGPDGTRSFKYGWYFERGSFERDKVSRKLNMLIKGQEEATMEILKNNIYTKAMALYDRQYSGIKYLLKGGNHDTKVYVEGELRNENPVQFDTIKKMLEAEMKK